MHTQPILSCSIRKQRPFRIVTASEELTCNFYEGPPFKYKLSHKKHTRYPNCIRYSPDGSSYISVGSDSKIFMYEGKTGEFIKEIEDKEHTHKGSIYAFSWSPDSKTICTVSGDKTTKVWDVEAGTCLNTFTHGTTIEDQQLGCVFTASHIYTIDLNGYITKICPKDGIVSKFPGHYCNITSASIDRINNLLYTSDMNGNICRTDINIGTCEYLQSNGCCSTIKTTI